MVLIDESASPLSGEVWPAHPQPRPDELFSSWLARLAHANGVSPHVLCALEWPRRRLLHIDLDRGAPPEMLERLARRASTTPARVQATTLGVLAGWLFERHDPLGRTRWLLPWAKIPGKHGGCQFCPECLVEDGDEPYLRRAWRLSFSTACPRHHRLLRVDCPGCGAGLAPFWCSTSQRGRPVEIPVASCRRCGCDLRRDAATSGRGRQGDEPDRRLLVEDDPAVLFQSRLHSVLEAGWAEVRGHGPVYSHLFFDVVHQLLKLLAAAGAETSRLAAAVRREISFGRVANRSATAAHKPQAVFFDCLPAGERHALLSMTGWLLEGWPERLVDLCSRERVRATTLLADMDPPPFWYERVVSEHLGTRPPCWRDPTRSKRQQVSYRVLTLRRTSRRLAAQERRIEFTRAHPELWDKPTELAKAMHAAGLYAPATHHSAIARHCPKLVALAKNPNEWWRDRRAKRAVVPDLHGPVRVR